MLMQAGASNASAISRSVAEPLPRDLAPHFHSGVLMQIRSLLAVTFAAAFATSLQAQSINVDIGSVATPPASTYGA